MLREQSGFPRRDFLTLAGLSLAGGAAAYWSLRQQNHIPDFISFHPDTQQSILEIENYNKILLNPPHPGLIKPVVNAAFSPYDPDPDTTRRVVHDAKKLGSNTIRVYLPNSFERTTGHFNEAYLDRLNRFLENVERHSEGETGVIVSLMDCYNLLYRDIHNGLYKAKPLDHHALNGITTPLEVISKQKEFFTDPKYIEDYRKRAQLVVNSLSKNNHVVRAWEVANEPDRPDMVFALNDWYSQTVPAIRDADPDKPIISGLKYPDSIDSAALKSYGLDHNSAHVYGSTELAKVKEYVTRTMDGEDLAPLLLLEHGAHRKVSGVPMPRIVHDYRSALALRELALNAIPTSEVTNEAYFGVYGFGLWQLDYSSSSHPEAESRDGFGILPDTYPRLTSAMQELSTVYTF